MYLEIPVEKSEKLRQDTIKL